MRAAIAAFVLLASLGGCAVVPVGYRDGDRGYARGDGYYRADSYYRGNYRGDGYYRGDRYYGNGAFSDHGQ